MLSFVGRLQQYQAAHPPLQSAPTTTSPPRRPLASSPLKAQSRQTPRPAASDSSPRPLQPKFRSTKTARPGFTGGVASRCEDVPGKVFELNGMEDMLARPWGKKSGWLRLQLVAFAQVRSCLTTRLLLEQDFGRPYASLFPKSKHLSYIIECCCTYSYYMPVAVSIPVFTM